MRNWLIVIFTLLLIACGGGSSDSQNTTPPIPPPAPTPPPTPPPPSPEPVMPAGVWVGTSINQSTKDSYQVGVLIAPSGEAHFLADDGEQVRAMIVLDGQNFSADALSFDSVGLLTTGTINGFYTDEAISADASVDGTVVSKLSFTVDPINSLGASLDRLVGTYATQDQSISIVFDDVGAISGSDTEGCVYSGAVRVPDPQINIFEISFDIENCGTANGSYTGLAALGSLDANGFIPLIYQVDNQEFAITNVFYK